MDETAGNALKAQIARLGIERVLIVTSNLWSLHGSPLVALDVGLVLAAAGVTVDFFSLELGPPLKSLLADYGFKCFDPVSNPRGIVGASYDLIWAQHWPAYGLILLELQVKTKYLALVSLSSYEPLETLFILLPEADVLVFNAVSTRDETMISLAAPGFDPPLAVTNNALPPDWFAPPFAPLASPQPRSIAIISNRMPDVLREAGRLLSAQGSEVHFVGMSDQPRMVDRELVDRFDVIVTIGHTVQKALARGRAVYCYDRFGGPGYITLSNIDQAEAHNFSGRDTPITKSGAAISAEILSNYADAITAIDDLRRIAADRYWLDQAITEVLAPIAAKAMPWSAQLAKTSAERKLVRQAVNQAVRYEFFTPDSAMVPGPTSDLVCLIRKIEPNESVLYFNEVKEPNPSMFAVSRLRRPVPIHGHFLPAPGMKLTAIEVCHDDGLVTSATINQPSPWLAGKFPNHPNSKTGSFTAKLMLHSGLGAAQLVAIFADGTRSRFFTIEIEKLAASP